MNPRLSIQIICQDEDLAQVEVQASNSAFAGATKVYFTIEELSDFSTSLIGFPKSNSPNVQFSGGDPSFCCYFKAEFYCINAAGHTAVQVTLESDEPRHSRPKHKHKVNLEFRFEAAALDRFQKSLANLVLSREGKAVLLGIGENTANVCIRENDIYGDT